MRRIYAQASKGKVAFQVNGVDSRWLHVGGKVAEDIARRVNAWNQGGKIALRFVYHQPGCAGLNWTPESQESRDACTCMLRVVRLLLKDAADGS